MPRGHRVEDETAEAVSKEPVAHIDGNDVGGGPLVRKAHLVPHSVPRFMAGPDLRQERSELRFMVRRYREMEAAGPIAVGNVLDSLFQMLFKGGATSIPIAMKLQEALGQVAVIQTTIGQ